MKPTTWTAECPRCGARTWLDREPPDISLMHCNYCDGVEVPKGDRWAHAETPGQIDPLHWIEVEADLEVTGCDRYSVFEVGTTDSTTLWAAQHCPVGLENEKATFLGCDGTPVAGPIEMSLYAAKMACQRHASTQGPLPPRCPHRGPAGQCLGELGHGDDHWYEGGHEPSLPDGRVPQKHEKPR